jgi:hypothetical protein
MAHNQIGSLCYVSYAFDIGGGVAAGGLMPAGNSFGHVNSWYQVEGQFVRFNTADATISGTWMWLGMTLLDAQASGRIDGIAIRVA